MLVEMCDVAVSGEEPEQLVGDPFEGQRLGRDEWKLARQVEAHLLPRIGPCGDYFSNRS
jgi:hypothetical protein